MSTRSIIYLIGNNRSDFIAQYVSNVIQNENATSLKVTINTWKENSKKLKESMDNFFEILKKFSLTVPNRRYFNFCI